MKELKSKEETEVVAQTLYKNLVSV